MSETLLQQTVYYSNYARWDALAGRRETWEETCARVIHFFRVTLDKKNMLDRISEMEWAQLHAAMLQKQVLPSMRIVQMAGPALHRCNVGAYNCAFLAIDDPNAFVELLYVLMQGTGVGFSVENMHIQRLQPVAKQTGEKWTTHVVEDSTEGWCRALGTGIAAWWIVGTDVEFDYSQVRPYGTPLVTKGGRASGPEPLKNLLTFVRKLLLAHQGKRLSSLNCHDIACYVGSIVQVGGVRRAAEISLSDLTDEKMRRAKQGEFWHIAPERSMSNNSVVYDSKPSMTEFFDEWRSLMLSGSGERGIFNREGYNKHQRPSRRWEIADYGLNPCGEIVLRNRQFCNLSIVVARPEDLPEDIAHKAVLATKFGILQSLLTDFGPMLSPHWKANCEDERLLGVDITGQCDNHYLSYPGLRHDTYKKAKQAVLLTAKEMSERFGINMPTATTCVKPSGNSSQLLDTSSGIHPRYAEFYIRRIRLASSNPVAQVLKTAGVPCHPENGQREENATIQVFEFPVQSPKGATIRKDVTALKQLEHWRECKLLYTEHNPSITVYVRPDEWMEVGAWVYKHWNEVGGISFLPYDSGVYMQPPYEEINRAEYEQRVQQLPELDLGAELEKLERVDTTELNREFACTGDRCEL